MAITTDDMPVVAGAAAPAAAAAVVAQPLVAVRVLLQFVLPGQADPEPDDVLQLPRALAHELAMYRKVEFIDAADTFTPADPAPAPAPASKAGKAGAS